MGAHPEWLSELSVVWTSENRSRYNRRGQIYPSDLTDEEWVILEPLLPVPTGKGRGHVPPRGVAGAGAVPRPPCLV
jgi:putative transposase